MGVKIVVTILRVRMERKHSAFPVGKRKRRGKTKMKTEIYKTEMEVEFFK